MKQVTASPPAIGMSTIAVERRRAIDFLRVVEVDDVCKSPEADVAHVRATSRRVGVLNAPW